MTLAGKIWGDTTETRDEEPGNKPRPRWEIRAIKWLINRVQNDFRLQVGHSLALVEPDPELYLNIVYGDDEVMVFDMSFDSETWQRIRASMGEMERRLAREYEEVIDE